jgi:hypothetical protein
VFRYYLAKRQSQFQPNSDSANSFGKLLKKIQW